MDDFHPDLVVGIDFGTTYSGVSWAVNAGQRNINHIKNWPNPKARKPSADKVPSVISYKNGRPDRWGFNALHQDGAIKWIKLLLEPDLRYPLAEDMIATARETIQQLKKTPVDIVSDYLRLLWQFAAAQIDRYHPEFQELFDVSVILTVPAMWSQAAKHNTLKAAQAASLPSRVILLSEPEAAAIATLKEKADLTSAFADLKLSPDVKTINAAGLKEGDGFVLCDAGGGTVDLISYNIHTIDPLRLQECVVGVGGLCGSVFIDAEVEKYIANIVGAATYQSLKSKSRRDMLEQFENGVKCAYDGNEGEQYTIELRGVPDNESAGILDGEVTLPASSLKAFFDHICSSVEKLVVQQISEIRKRDIHVKAILLVGGFGESAYLHSRLQSTFSPENVQVLQNAGAWSATCRGATLWGLEHADAQPTVLVRRARYSCGYCIYDRFDETQHDPKDFYLDPVDNVRYARNQMRWLTWRGKEYLIDQIIDAHDIFISRSVEKLQSCESIPIKCALYYCNDEYPPTRVGPSVKRLCTIRFGLPTGPSRQETPQYNPTNGTYYHNMYCRPQIILRNTDMAFQVIYKDSIVGMTTVHYMDDEETQS